MMTTGLIGPELLHRGNLALVELTKLKVGGRVGPWSRMSALGQKQTSRSARVSRDYGALARRLSSNRLISALAKPPAFSALTAALACAAVSKTATIVSYAMCYTADHKGERVPVLAQHAMSDPDRIMLEHIAETWYRIANSLPANDA